MVVGGGGHQGLVGHAEHLSLGRQLLQQLAAQRQVFCVTHQPLVAAAADHHFRVAKEVREGRTHTRVSQLRDTQARQAELAELAGGDSGETRSYAASLLKRELNSGQAA